VRSPHPIRVLIVDDERLAREGVRALLEGEPDVSIAGECADGPSAIDAIRAGGIDVMLLDVQMPGMSGLDVLREIPEASMPVVVFLTAHDEYALRAFDASALDYVVKPFSDARFHTAISRARRQVHERRLGAAGVDLAALVDKLAGAGEPPASPARWRDRFVVRSVGRVSYVPVSDVIWIGAADYYAELHTVDGKRHLVRETMQAIESRLDPSRFVRVHRTAIVRLDQVAELRTDGADRHVVVLRNGVRVPLGKSRRESVEQRLASR
jgi:two-component system, LytTR family, response regulator